MHLQFRQILHWGNRSNLQSHHADIVLQAILLASSKALNFTIKEVFKKLKADAYSKQAATQGRQ